MQSNMVTAHQKRRAVSRVAFGNLRATPEHADGVWSELRAALAAEVR